MSTEQHTIRKATNKDSAKLIALISEVYSEYGETMFTEGADSDLLDIEGRYAEKGGAFVVLENPSGEIVGCHATSPIDIYTGLLTFRRLYLDRSQRGGGLGKRLMDWAMDWAHSNKFNRVEFWSDTRFSKAHAFFERYGFERCDEIREMNDGVEPYREYFFSADIPLTPC